jgi:superfamily II DNA or RNA helicase
MAWALKYDLRDWQRSAIEEWRANHWHGIVEVVTGGGKTVFAEACILDRAKAWPNLKTLLVVPTVALLDQWHVALQEELGVDPHDLAVFHGSVRSKLAKINLAVINTARRLASKLSAVGDWMLVVDECHRSGSPKNMEALQGSYRATLGLSATPERQYDDALSKAIIPALGPVICRYDIARARRDGIITAFSLHNIEIDLLPDEAIEYKRITGRIIAKMRGQSIPEEGERSVPAAVEALLRARARVVSRATMRIPVCVHVADKHKGRRVMIFHESRAAASKIVEILRARGHSATIYHTGIGPVIRRSNLRLYRRGVFDVIASCRALDEGINVPETEIAIIASATATTRQRIQRLGRTLRPSPGKSMAIIYTLFATETERKRLKLEEANLEEVASVVWSKASRGNGA